MQWSRLKKMVESRFCDTLENRVQIYLSRYTRACSTGRLWIVLDQQEILSAGDGFSPKHAEWYLKDLCVVFNREWACSSLEKQLIPFLSLSIEEALTSDQELVRALAMFDKRVGKRRLQLLAHSMLDEPLLVQHFFALRCEAENLYFEPGSRRQTPLI